MRIVFLHPRSDLQRLLDGRLPEAHRAALAAHLASCAPCRNELAALRRLATQLAPLRTAPPPPALARAIRATLDTEDAGTRRDALGWTWRWAAVAAALIAGLGLALLLPGRSADLTALASADLHRVEAGGDTLVQAAGDRAALEGWFGTAGLDFELHVYDLSAFGLELLGGRVHRLAGRPTGFYVYRTPDGRRVLCEMVRGSLAELPAGGVPRYRDDGLELRVFVRDGTTLACWQEGPVLCVLAASRVSPAELATWAFAKAARS